MLARSQGKDPSVPQHVVCGVCRAGGDRHCLRRVEAHDAARLCTPRGLSDAHLAHRGHRRAVAS